MNRIFSRNGLYRKSDLNRNSQRHRRRFAATPNAESLEDRTLLSLNWALVGPGLQNIFSQVQASVNDHFLNPAST